jgi:hypothetical protein
MKCFFHICLLSFASIVIFNSCTKNNNNTTGTGGTGNKPPDSTVYIAGDNGTNPILWQNGIPDTLSTTVGTATQVIVSGSDVYVAGISQEIINYASPGVLAGPIRGQYAYWKNGTQNNIDSFQDVSGTVSIAVIGSNVYYTNGKAWENGSVIALPGLGSGAVVAVFASGSDIYFVGSDSAQDAVYWKNGQMNIVSAYQGRGSTLPHVHCIYVSGTDVYVGGMFNQAAYWKNGAINYLQYSSINESVGSVSSIFVSGNDVYTTGYLMNTINGVPAYWKNGVENDLALTGSPNPGIIYSTSSVFLMGSDIYVAGYSATLPLVPTMLATYAPVFWKNNVETVLAPAGYAFSVVVH